MRNSIIFLSLLVSFSSLANESSFKNSVKQTQEVLEDKSSREKAIKESSEGQKADEQIKKLAKDEKTYEQYYKLASEIFGNFSDEESMRKNVSEGQRDPAQFYQKLTPEQKKKIKELAEKLNPGVPTSP